MASALRQRQERYSQSSDRTGRVRLRCSTSSRASLCRTMAACGLAVKTSRYSLRRGLSRSFQNLQIFSQLTALENVMVGRHRHESTGLAADLLHLPTVSRHNRMTSEAALYA